MLREKVLQRNYSTDPTSEDPGSIFLERLRLEPKGVWLAELQPREIIELCRTIKKLLDTEQHEVFDLITRSPSADLSMFVAAWLHDDPQLVISALERTDGNFEGDLAQKCYDFRILRPYDEFTKSGASQPHHFPTVHQLPVELLVSVGYFAGLGTPENTHLPYTLGGNLDAVFTHPHVEEWEGIGNIGLSAEGLPHKIWEHEDHTDRRGGLHYIAEKYPDLFKLIESGISQLAATHSDYYLYIPSADGEKNFRYAYRMKPELVPSVQYREVVQTANEIAHRIRAVAEQWLGEFESDSRFVEALSLFGSGVHSDIRSMLNDLLRSVLGTAPTSPTFYEPSFACVVDYQIPTQSSEEPPQHKKDLIVREGTGFDEYGSLLFWRDPNKITEPIISAAMMKGVIIFTERIGQAETDLWLKKIVKTLQLGYADAPAAALPIYDDSGNMLWPKRLSYQEVIALSNNIESDPDKAVSSQDGRSRQHFLRHQRPTSTEHDWR